MVGDGRFDGRRGAFMPGGATRAAFGAGPLTQEIGRFGIHVGYRRQSGTNSDDLRTSVVSQDRKSRPLDELDRHSSLARIALVRVSIRSASALVTGSDGLECLVFHHLLEAI